MNQPTDIFKPVYRCSNCGALLNPEAIKCTNCSATFRAVDVVDPVRVQHDESPEIVKYYDYTNKGIAYELITSVPNGCAVTSGIGGIGDVVPNHYITMGEKLIDEPLTWSSIALTWSSIAKAITIVRMEGYASTTMLIHPIQMYEMVQMGDFIGATERAFFELPNAHWKKNIEGLIGMIGGMYVIVSAAMTSGMSVIFDNIHFPTERSAGVLLCGGRTSINE